MEISRVTTPKEFFVKERDSFYSLWTLSFWREFFQNSVDAGSRNIDITINEASGRGEFDKIGDSSKKITRIVFSDDGVGMTEEILNNVYFSIGQTTKSDDSSVGGYGRARLMTCFSQDRYSILTKDRFVMGNGPDYVNFSLDEAEYELAKSIENLKLTSHTDEDINNLEVSRNALAQDLEMVRAAKAAGGYKGCRIEVDLDQQTGNYLNHPTVETMAARLRTYISESQIKANVTINGKSPEIFFEAESKIQARRGKAKRTLSAEINGEVVDFATVHISDSDKAIHKGKAIVRVDGASMFTTSLDADTQVIIEIDPKISRQVLTSNRDGMKEGFNDSLYRFLNELSIDNTSALADKMGKDNYKIEGERGMLTATAPNISEIITTDVTFEEQDNAGRITKEIKKSSINTIEDLKTRGLSQDAIDDLIMQTRWGDSIISKMRWSYNFPLQKDIDDFIQKMNFHYDEEDAKASLFLKHASAPLKEWVVRTLHSRHEHAMRLSQKENEDRLKDMNDVYVSVISANDKTRTAIRRNDPRKWDVSNGRGRIPRALLSAWTAACSVAVETLMKTRPSVQSFKWTTGWVYAVPENTYQGDRVRSVSIEAQHLNQNGEHKFLLNPVKEDGILRYSLTNPKDRQRMQALAMHEIAHVLEQYHNESYAGILTDMISEYDINEANKRMKEAIKAVLSAYEKGRVTVQEMDSEAGPRPAERLLALATANDPEAAKGAISANEDGTYEIDTELLQDHVIDKPTPNEDHEVGVRYGH